MRTKGPGRWIQPLFFFLSLFFFTGCYPQQRYQYQQIQKDYASLSCQVVPTAGKEDEKAVCRLDHPLSLKCAIRFAVKNNPDQIMAAARIQNAQALLDQAGAPFYPYIGFYTEYSRGDAPSASLFKTIDQRQLGSNANFNNPGVYDNFETGVKGQLNLFNGGKDLLQRQMAETGLQIQRLDEQAVRNTLVSSVINHYYDYLAAADYIGIVKDSIAAIAEQLRIMKVRFEEGGALKSDLLSLEVRLAQAREDLVKSRNRLKITRAVLASVLGISVDQDFTVESSSRLRFEIPGEYAAGIVAAVRMRPELHKVRRQLEQSRMALDMARSGYLPRVDLQGKYYLDDPDMDYDRDRENWMAAVILNWDLFTGFATRAEKGKAAARIEELLAADRKVLLSVQLDVKTAYLEKEAAEARLSVAQSSVAMAEESLQLVKKQYLGGSATVTRYLEAELARNTARTRSTAAYYDREKAYADVGRATGYFTKDL